MTSTLATSGTIEAQSASALDELRTSLRDRLPRDGAVMLLARVTSDQTLRDQVAANIRDGTWPEFTIANRPAGECGRPSIRPHVVRVMKGASHAVPAVGRGDAAGRDHGRPADRPAAAPAAAPEPAPAAVEPAGRAVAVKAPYGKYAAFKARVALMRPGEELQWPDAPTANISAYLAKWGEVFGFTIRQFKGEDGHRWIRRIRDEEAAPKATVENGGIPSEDAGLRRLLRAGHSLADARRIVAEVAVSHKPASPAQVSHKPAPAPAPVAVTPAPQAPPEPATAKPCGCDAGGYCYDCTTPEQRAKLDASLIADGSAVLEKLEALADRGEAIVMGAAIEIIPAAKMPPSPLKNRAGRGELRAAIARLKPGEGVVWDDPPKPSTAYSILAKWNRKLPFNVGTFLHDGKRYIQRREETPR